jgi:hypothetical protein
MKNQTRDELPMRFAFEVSDDHQTKRQIAVTAGSPAIAVYKAARQLDDNERLAGCAQREIAGRGDLD